MARLMNARFASKCKSCRDRIAVGDTIWWSKDGGAVHESCRQADTEDDREYARGYNDVARIQAMSAAGSELREQLYMQLEEQWAREGFDG